MACINFMNLATARSIKRTKEVGLRKVIGANRSQLIKQFLGESILISAIAFVFALAIVELFLPAFSNFTGKPLSIDFSNIEIFIGLICLLIFTGIISGSYPAIFLSSFTPVKILKGPAEWYIPVRRCSGGCSSSASSRFLSCSLSGRLSYINSSII